MSPLRDPHDGADVPERLLGERQILLGRGAAAADPRDPLVDQRRRVRHRPHDARAGGQMRLDEAWSSRPPRRRAPSCDAGSVGAISASTTEMSCGFTRDDHEPHALDRERVGRLGPHAVTLAELGERARRAAR